jgi:glycosyltransferase involved in cell wall biosynthesis
MLLSVIVPTRNSASTIRDALSSIFSNKLSRKAFEVLIVDYKSCDGTLNIAKEFSTRIIRCENRGHGVARNLGIREAKGEILCFTDSDCIVERDWLAKISEFFESHPEVDGVGGPTLAHPKPWNKIQELAGEIFVEDQGFPTTPMKVQFGKFKGTLFATNSAFRKNALVSVGGFTPGGNCLELSWRLVANGNVLIFEPSLKAYHRLPSDVGGIFNEQFRWGASMTAVEKRLGFFKLRSVILEGYFLVRALLLLPSFKDWSKKLLHFYQLVAFSLGRLVGMGTTYYL